MQTTNVIWSVSINPGLWFSFIDKIFVSKHHFYKFVWPDRRYDTSLCSSYIFKIIKSPDPPYGYVLSLSSKKTWCATGKKAFMPYVTSEGPVSTCSHAVWSRYSLFVDILKYLLNYVSGQWRPRSACTIVHKLHKGLLHCASYVTGLIRNPSVRQSYL